MGRNVKVSIVVPCYNVESYINQCIDSIISQTLRDIEIICVNDGSKDHTLEILKEYASKDERIKLIDKQNSGYGDSMNMGMQAACGEYIGIVESDDFVDQRMFEVLYKVAHKHNADVVKSNFWLYWGETGKDELFEYFDKDECGFAIKPSSYFDGGIFGRKPSIWSAIYRTNFLREIIFHFCQHRVHRFKTHHLHLRCLLHVKEWYVCMMHFCTTDKIILPHQLTIWTRKLILYLKSTMKSRNSFLGTALIMICIQPLS